jgi:hypothetical protein
MDTMESNTIVEEKFNNFKVFMKSIQDIDYKYIMLLDQCNIATFLHGLATYKGLTVDEIVLKVFEKADIKINNVTTEQKDKFKKYINFFQDVINIFKI